MARNSTNCSSCSSNNCDCNTVVSREIIQDDPTFCVVVNGDYQADADDEVVHVKAGLLDSTGAVIVPVITLPCPSDVDRDCAHITIVAQGGDVRIDGLNDTGIVNVDGVPSAGSRILAGGTAVTFWLTQDDAATPCTCSTAYWIAQCCGLTLPPA